MLRDKRAKSAVREKQPEEKLPRAYVAPQSAVFVKRNALPELPPVQTADPGHVCIRSGSDPLHPDTLNSNPDFAIECRVAWRLYVKVWNLGVRL